MKPLLQYALPALLTGLLGFSIGYYVQQEQPLESLAHSPVQHNKPPLLSPVPGDSPSPEPLNFRDIFLQTTLFDKQHFAYQFASVSNLAQLKESMELVIDDRDPLFNLNIAGILLEGMIAIDPLEALAFIKAHQQINQNYFISHLLTSWIREDPEPAIDYFKSLTNVQLRNAIGARLLEDPTLRQSGLVGEIETALGRYADQINEQVRLKRMQPADAFEEASLRTDHQRRRAMNVALARWFRQDPEAVLRHLTSLTNRHEKQQLMQVIISIQSQQDPEEALRLLSLYAPDDRNLRQQALRQYANLDPVAALPRIESWVEEFGNYDLLGNLVSRWVQLDKTAALAYIETIGEQSKEAVFRQLAFSYINHSPEEGMEWLMSLDSKYDQGVKQTAISALANYPEVAEDWLDRLDDKPGLQGMLLTRVASQKAQNNPADAYQWLDSYGDSPQVSAARSSVLQQWAHRDPESVADLLAADSGNTNFTHVYNTTASRWVQLDPDAAINWIDSLDDPQNKQSALSGAISQFPTPDRVIPMLDSLPAQQSQNLKLQLAYNLVAREPENVERIIRNLKLSEQNAEVIRNQIQNQSNVFLRSSGYR